MNTATATSIFQPFMPIVFDALEKMIEQANAIGVTVGVAQITIIHNIEPLKQFTLTATNTKGRTLKRENVPGKANVNYAAVVAAKIAQMRRTDKSSGADDGFIGEVPYKGGIRGVSHNGNFTVYVAYSGGTEDEDVMIAKPGLVGVITSIDQ